MPHPQWESDDGKQADNSLQGKALDRANNSQPPKTLTPYEWEQWYADHGVPPSHRSSPPPNGLWKKFLAILKP